MSKVTSYRELMAEQAKAAVRVAGADHSSWNGQFVPADPDRKVRGAVKWDNTIEYNDERVTAPLKEMFANARVHNQDQETLQWYREALKTTLHENVHLLAGEGTEHSDAMRAFATAPGARPLEEGVTEVYSYNNLNAYIDDLGLEEIAPGIRSAPAHPSYRQFTPAAQTFADSIGRRSGVGGDEVIRRMAVVNAEQKFRVAAATIYDTSDLPGLVPADQRDAAIQRIEASMRPPFARINDLSASSPDQVRRQSALAGGQAADAGYQEVRTLRQQWAQPPRAVAQEAQQTQQGPQRSERSGGGGLQASPGPQPGGQQPSPSGKQGHRPQEHQDAIRAGLGGTAPMAGAKRLSPDQFGSRQGDTSPGWQRKGPEREV
jgi:hypothetical protein